MSKPTSHSYDLIIIGAGPTGLTAATYAAREGMNTLVLEKGAVGGLAAITDQIDNYPGFPEGVGGLELAERLKQQAERFEAKIRPFTEVTGLTPNDDGLTVKTVTETYASRAVLIATGSSYKKLGIPGEEEQIGKRIHFCATCDGPLYRGRDIVVVGGGNSAVQETLYLAKYARHITMLVRSDELKASAVLVEATRQLPNVEIVYNLTTTKVESKDGRFTAIEGIDTTTRTTKRYEPDGIFVFVGMLANTQSFTMGLAHDERNFLVTDAHYRTQMPGVFVAGDVRSGSTWQIAAAVGEGASAALEIRAYLEHEERDKPQAS